MPKKSQLKCYLRCTVDGPLHRFPKWQYPHEEKFNSWKAVLSPTTQEYNNEYIYNNIRLCYRHFEKCYQLPSHQLTRNAVPTLCLSMPTIGPSSCAPTPSTHPASNSDILLNVSKNDRKNRGMSGATLVTLYKLPSRDSKNGRKNRGMSRAKLVTLYKLQPRGIQKKIYLLQQTIKKQN